MTLAPKCRDQRGEHKEKTLWDKTLRGVTVVDVVHARCTLVEVLKETYLIRAVHLALRLLNLMFT